MPGTNLAALRPVLATGILLAGFLIASTASSQTKAKDELLDHQRRLQEVSAQKLEGEIGSLLREAQRLNVKNPSRAIEKLNLALGKLEDDDSVLDPKRRDALIRVVKDRIRVSQLPDPPVEKSSKPETRRQRDQEKRQSADQEEIKRSIDSIRDLRKEGKLDEANRRADELIRQYPDSPAALAAARTAAIASQLANARGLSNDGERRFASAYRDVDRSATPSNGDVEFPKDFKERTKGRSATTPLTAKEKSILRALNTPMTIKFKDSRFEDVIEYLKTVTNQPIMLDQSALDEAKLNYDTPVTLNIRDVSLRTVLRKILGDFGLTYIIKDETIQVTSMVKARETLVTRSYNIRDLVDPGNSVLWGPGINAVQTAQNVNAIMELIQTSVDPESWTKNGGKGTIVFHGPSMSLVIKNTAEVHGMIGGGLFP
jgi:hypothetical protein